MIQNTSPYFDVQSQLLHHYRISAPWYCSNGVCRCIRCPYIEMTDPVTTPPTKPDDGRPDIAKSLFPAPPDSAVTARLPSPMQREHDESCAAKSRRILNISDVTRIRLRRRIQKIYYSVPQLFVHLVFFVWIKGCVKIQTMVQIYKKC